MSYSHLVFDNKVKTFQTNYDFFHPSFELTTKQSIWYPNNSWLLVESADYDVVFSPGELVSLVEYNKYSDSIDEGTAVSVIYEGLIDIDGDSYYDGALISEGYSEYVLTDKKQFLDYSPFNTVVTLDKVSSSGTGFVTPVLPPEIVDLPPALPPEVDDVPPVLPPAPDPNEIILGTSGDDSLDGLEGNDVLKGLAGDDVLSGGAGSDTLKGGSGNDVLVGDAGEDQLWGGKGADLLDGGSEADRLIGGGGRDAASYVTANSGVRADLSRAGSNSGDAKGDAYRSIENILGSAHDDKLYGDRKANYLYGDDGEDVLSGSAGNDHLYGGNDNDVLLGANGSDKLLGEAGHDRIAGSKGRDVLKGGDGSDTFVFNRGDGRDRILDFQNGVDVIEIGRGADHFSNIEFTKVKGGALVEFANVDIFVKGFKVSDIDGSDFDFV